MAHTADHALLDVLVDAVVDNAPDIAVEMRKEEWRAERDPARLEQMLIDSATIVRDVVTNRLATGR
jgi:hypothetical protein